MLADCLVGAIKLKKPLIIILVMLLGLYPVVELTRMIWTNGIAYFPELRLVFMVETIIMWDLYLAIIPVLRGALK